MEEVKTVEVHPTTKALVDGLSELCTPEGFQKMVLGFKKNGSPRAVYDVVKDFREGKKGKKKKKGKKNKKNKGSSYEFYLGTKGKKKKKNKKKNKKHWYYAEF